MCDSFIPNMAYLAPTSKEEYFAMLNWSIEQNEHPVAPTINKTNPITINILDKIIVKIPFLLIIFLVLLFMILNNFIIIIFILYFCQLLFKTI